MQSFYLADVKEKSVKGDIVDTKGVLFFKQDRSGYDGKATKEHVKSYPHEFQNFKNANPDFVLPDTFVDVEIGSALVNPHVDDAEKSPLKNEFQAAEAVKEKGVKPHAEQPEGEPKSELKKKNH